MNFKPHLESEDYKFTGEKDEIPKVAHESWDQIISKTKGRYLAIEVVAQSCQGCKSIEVILPKLKDSLSKHDISLCQVNLMTELPWLQDIQVTPSFILYDKRTKLFKDVNTEDSDEQNQNQESGKQALEEILTEKIINELK